MTEKEREIQQTLGSLPEKIYSGIRTVRLDFEIDVSISGIVDTTEQGAINQIMALETPELFEQTIEQLKDVLDDYRFTHRKDRIALLGFAKSFNRSLKENLPEDICIIRVADK